jgi:cytidylate kinase
MLGDDMRAAEGRERRLRIAIDGPAGAGKSTLAEALAGELKLPYVNTGLMYRAVTESALREGEDPDDEGRLAWLAERLSFTLSDGAVPELRIDGAPPKPELRSESVERTVSRVARHPAVRRLLRDRQRDLGRDGCVMEGRDIGTVVLPEADVKIFLAAHADVRARRRAEERGLAGGTEAREVAAAVARRDAMDGRTNPLVPAADAHVLDSTKLDRAALLEAALAIVRRAAASAPAP